MALADSARPKKSNGLLKADVIQQERWRNRLSVTEQNQAADGPHVQPPVEGPQGPDLDPPLVEGPLLAGQRRPQAPARPQVEALREAALPQVDPEAEAVDPCVEIGVARPLGLEAQLGVGEGKERDRSRDAQPVEAGRLLALGDPQPRRALRRLLDCRDGLVSLGQARRARPGRLGRRV